MDIFTIVWLVIALLIIVIIGLTFIFKDLMSYTATDVESMNPAGDVTGKALVVYAPGISGMAKNVAIEIADELKSTDYYVDLAGVRSAAATKTSAYDIVITGGPMYFGKLSKSMESYIKTLRLQKEVNLGIFTTTGSEQFNGDDFQSLKNQVEILTEGISLIKR